MIYDDSYLWMIKYSYKYLIQKLKMDKIGFLQRQNQQLRDQVQQLRQIISVNKVQIDILSNQLNSKEDNKKLMEVIFSYREKQQKLQNTIIMLKKQITQFSSDNLMLRQLNDGQNIEMKNMETLHLQAVQMLNQKMKEMQEKIAYYEKSHKQYDKVSGFVLKNRDIVGPSDIAMELKNKEYEWQDQICMMKAEVSHAKKNQEHLIVVNTVLRNKIVSLQAQLAMPNRNLGEVLDKSLKKLMLYFIEVQKKIITGEEESDSDEQNDIQLIAPQLAGVFPEKQLRIQRDYGVPHLDLLKIREQMNHSSNKIKQALLARNHLSDRQKIQRLQIQLQYTRRQLSRNIIDLRDQRQKRRKAGKFITQLQARNELLISSNEHLQAKVRKYWHKLKSQREKAYGMNENLQTGKGLVDQQFNQNLDQTLKVKSPSKIKDNNKENKKNSSNIFSLNEYTIDYKIHLQIMAQELKKNKKLENVQKLKPVKQQSEQVEAHHTKKMKRSTSNPLLYFNQRKANIMSIHQDYAEQKNQRERLQQTCYNPGEVIGFEDVLDEYEDMQ